MIVYILVLVVYLGLLAAIGMIMSGLSRSVGDFAIGGRSVGPWVTALLFVAAYYLSVAIIGGGAFGWKFGLATLWVGAGNVLVGTTVALVVIVIGTFAGRSAPRECVDRAWGAARD